MKNKEESSMNSQRGCPYEQADLYRSDCVGSQTTGTLSRPGPTVAARIEQPALSDFSESLMESIVDRANMAIAWKNVRANRGAPGPDGVTIAEFPEWNSG
jgi:RNA-directed DNA polymerase